MMDNLLYDLIFKIQLNKFNSADSPSLQVAVPLLLISAVGWLVYVVGYSMLYQELFR